MKNDWGFDKLGLRLGLLATIVLACNLGSVASPSSQSDPAFTSPSPDITNLVEAAVTQEITLQPDLFATISPTSSFTLQPFKTATFQPTEALADPAHKKSNSPAEIIPLEVVWQMLGEVNQERTLTDLRRLTGEEQICTGDGCYTIINRETGTEGLQRAKDYVYETLADLNYSVEVLDWSRNGYTDQNIIARKQGVVYLDEEIYFIAHLDGYLLDNPAADDDASGVVSLLELARILSSRPLSYTVVLFFSTGEEHGSLGSHSFVEEYPERLDVIKYLVSIEMLGYDSDDDGKMEFWNGDQPLDLVQQLTEIIGAYQIDLVPEIVSGCT